MVTDEAPPIMILRRVSVSLFLMAARQAEMTCALGLPAVSEKEERGREGGRMEGGWRGDREGGIKGTRINTTCSLLPAALALLSWLHLVAVLGGKVAPRLQKRTAWYSLHAF